MKLKLFRKLGHRILFIKGGFTARFGNSESADYTYEDNFKVFKNEEIAKFGEQYRHEITKILGPFVPENNLYWYNKMSLNDFIEIASNFYII